MNCNILITFFLILQRNVDCTIENDKIEAVAALSEQLVNGISDYISECNLVPVGKSCQISNVPMKMGFTEEQQDLVKVLVWSKYGKIVEVLSLLNYSSQVLHQFGEVVIFVHDMGESSCSERMKDLIVQAYLKKPNVAVISLDYSPVVGFFKMYYFNFFIFFRILEYLFQYFP